MIEILETNAKDILGFRVDGKIEKPDMEKVLKALEDKAAENGRLKFLAEIDNFSFTDISSDAIKEEFLFWFKHPALIADIGKAAVVTDSKLIEAAFEVECAVIPTLEGRSFSIGEREKALEWLETDQREQSRLDITFSELAETSTLKFASGFAIGLLAAGFFKEKQRKNVGAAVMCGTLLAGIPLGIKILNNNRRLIGGD